jgi:hypothetical protein
MSDTTVTTTPPPPPPPTTMPPPATAWHTGIEPETLGFWQNKGYDITDPVKFGAAITKQYRDLEKHMGAPADQLLRMPKADAKPEEIAAFRQRLGMPADPKEYDLSAVKDTSVADALRATAHQTGLSKDAAAAVASAVAKALESKTTTDSVVNAAKLAEEKTALAKSWGDKYNFNLLQANEGARRSSITPEAVKAMENQVGYAAVMEHFRKIGANTSEDTFVERDGGGGTGVATREGAMARKNELMSDPAWGKRFTSGDAEARREYDRLNAMIGE